MPLLRAVLADPALAIGLYAAVVATGVAVLQWRAHRKDRGALKLRGAIHAFELHGPSVPDPHAYVAVTNVGRRVIEIADFGLLGRGKLAPRAYYCPKARLEEAADTAIGIAAEDIFSTDVVTVYVKDTAGRMWQMPRREFRRFREDFRAQLEAADAQARELEESAGAGGSVEESG